GNCPQYIQARKHELVPAAADARPRAVRAETGLLSPAAAVLVRNADTFFIASASRAARGSDPVAGVDVSHRGGMPGFARVEGRDGRTVLTAPDFAGNSSFNTFGNLAVNPHAGLLFVDFVAGNALTLIGQAEIVWDGPELAAFAGAQRLLRVTVEEGVWL